MTLGGNWEGIPSYVRKPREEKELLRPGNSACGEPAAYAGGGIVRSLFSQLLVTCVNHDGLVMGHLY